MPSKKKTTRKAKNNVSAKKNLKLYSANLYGKSVYQNKYIHGNIRESEIS